MFWFLYENGVFSQPDVLQLGEVADFEALTFNLALMFI
jgi:hypothetical protein